MDIQDLVSMLVGGVEDDPDLLGSLMEHPYSTIGNLTGNPNVSSEEASQAVTAMAGLASGQSVDFNDLGSVASQLLAGNGGSVHSLASALLGSGSTQGVNVSNGVSTDILANITSAFAGGGPRVDLSDGIGVDDVIGFASFFLGGKK